MNCPFRAKKIERNSPALTGGDVTQYSNINACIYKETLFRIEKYLIVASTLFRFDTIQFL